MRQADVVVVGAGVVGLAAALAIQKRGRDVLLIDRASPAMGCSSGNAGIIANSEILPLSNGRILARAPALLLDPLGPLAIPIAYFPKLLPWLIQSALQALPRRQERIIAALRTICGEALAAHCRLLQHPNFDALIRQEGMLDVVRREQDKPLLVGRYDALRRHGIEAELVDVSGVAELEPALAGQVSSGVHYGRVAHVSDPYQVALAYRDRFLEAGGKFEIADVRGVEIEGDGAAIATSKGSISANDVVVAANLDSSGLIKRFVGPIPLEAERGYHLHLPRSNIVLTRPVSFLREGFVATPLASGLRLAGTAEFAGRAAPPNWRRADNLLPLARRYFPSIRADGAERWMGVRSIMADSLPAIGRVAGTPICYGFGHQHLGLTLAAITGECLAALVCGQPPPIALEPFDLERFSR